VRGEGNPPEADQPLAEDAPLAQVSVVRIVVRGVMGTKI